MIFDTVNITRRQYIEVNLKFETVPPEIPLTHITYSLAFTSISGEEPSTSLRFLAGYRSCPIKCSDIAAKRVACL